MFLKHLSHLQTYSPFSCSFHFLLIIFLIIRQFLHRCINFYPSYKGVQFCYDYFGLAFQHMLTEADQAPRCSEVPGELWLHTPGNLQVFYRWSHMFCHSQGHASLSGSSPSLSGKILGILLQQPLYVFRYLTVFHLVCYVPRFATNISKCRFIYLFIYFLLCSS